MKKYTLLLLLFFFEITVCSESEEATCFQIFKRMFSCCCFQKSKKDTRTSPMVIIVPYENSEDFLLYSGSSGVPLRGAGSSPIRREIAYNHSARAVPKKKHGHERSESGEILPGSASAETLAPDSDMDL